MKKDIHPQYFPKATIKCVCGQEFEIGSTQEEVRVEICSSCHPFYTGKKNSIDAAGQIEKFNKKLAKQKTLGKAVVAKKVKQAKRADKKTAKKSDD